MALIRTASYRLRAGVLRQLAVSVTATVAATLIISGLQHELAMLRPTGSTPLLTSGGKFAARVEALRAEADAHGDAVALAPHVPLLVADSALQALPIVLDFGSGPAEARATVDAAKPGKRTAHGESRRRVVAEAAIDVLPPRRSDTVVAATTVTASSEDSSESHGMWTATKGLYRRAVWFGGDMLDRVNPLNLLP